LYGKPTKVLLEAVWANAERWNKYAVERTGTDGLLRLDAFVVEVVNVTAADE